MMPKEQTGFHPRGRLAGRDARDARTCAELIDAENSRDRGHAVMLDKIAQATAMSSRMMIVPPSGGCEQP